MQKDNKSVLDMAEINYYKDSKIWYMSKYVNPFIEKNLIIFILLFFLLSIFIAEFFYLRMASLNSEKLYLNKSSDITEHYAKIKDLKSLNENPNIALEKYMCKTYVLKRESYNSLNISSQTKFIQKSSTKEVYNEFINSFSINNAESFLLQYPQNSVRSIEIDTITKSPEDKNTYFVEFNAIVSSPKETNNEKTRWKSKITFDLSSIEKHIANNSKTLDYMVIKYTSQKLLENPTKTINN